MGPLRRYSPVATFVAGFLFDLLTMQRIDAWTDLAFQLAYLVLLTGLLVYQQKEATGAWVPTGVTARWWRYNVDALHFLYGGLLSAYVVLYVRSSTGTSSIAFLVLLVGVMVLNEVPRLRQAGHALRLGLYAFCVLSFLNYFIPILVGRIAGWVFLLSLLLSAIVVWRVAALLVPRDAEGGTRQRWLFAPAGGVLLLIGGALRAAVDPAGAPLGSVPGHLSRRPARRRGLHAGVPSGRGPSPSGGATRAPSRGARETACTTSRVSSPRQASSIAS